MADIGGGEGLFLSSLLRQHPGMRGILFDRQAGAPSSRLPFTRRWPCTLRPLHELVVLQLWRGCCPAPPVPPACASLGQSHVQPAPAGRK